MAAAPAGGSYTVNADKTNISLNPDIGCTRETFGSNTPRTSLISTATSTWPAAPTQLERGHSGKVTAVNGLIVTDGTNPLGLGQTDGTGQIDVTGLSADNTSTLLVSRPRDH